MLMRRYNTKHRNGKRLIANDCRWLLVDAKSGFRRGTHRASRSLSSRARMSFSFTGPLTFRMSCRCESSKNSTRTWVTPPREPVLPRTCRNPKINGHSTRARRRGLNLDNFCEFYWGFGSILGHPQYVEFTPKDYCHAPFFLGKEDDDRMSNEGGVDFVFTRVKIRFNSGFEISSEITDPILLSSSSSISESVGKLWDARDGLKCP